MGMKIQLLVWKYSDTVWKEAMLSGPLVITAWYILRLRMEETASIYG
jgi:hypothetical protein